MADGRKSHAEPREWYSVAVSTVRLWTVFAILVVLTVVGFVAFHRLQAENQEAEAARLISRGDQLLAQVASRAVTDDWRAGHREAATLLDDARGAYAEERWPDAYQSANEAVGRIEGLLGIGDGGGEIRFVYVHGGVEFRRGERGAWKRARKHDSLDAGDWVKTATDGTAQIALPDNSLYTLRQNTMVQLGGLRGRNGTGGGGGKETTEVVFGWVELNTAQRESRVSTPRSQAKVDRNTEALVAYDANAERSRFAAYEGQLEVSSDDGESRVVSANEQVVQDGDGLSEAQPLPTRPRLSGPADHFEIDLESQDRLQLAWDPVDDARRYKLQVSSNRQFATTIIDDERRRTEATVGIRGEGNFYWQVAAVDRSGIQGRWSAPRAFRVVSLRGIRQLVDEEPPPLDIDKVDAFGSLALIEGTTEPGATVSVNQQPVTVGLNGRFSTTLDLRSLLDAAGLSVDEASLPLEFIATDASGNETVVTRSLALEAY